jgi:hypothetical protein
VFRSSSGVSAPLKATRTGVFTINLFRGRDELRLRVLEAEIVDRQAEASERRVVLTRTLAKLRSEASSCRPSKRMRSRSIC